MPNPQHCALHNSPTTAGFTLVELLVALAVLSIAALGVVMVSSATTTGNYRSKNEAAATALAMAKIEKVKSTAFAAIDSSCVADPGTLNETGQSGGIYTRNCSFSNGVINGVSVKNITVSVGWTGGGSVALTTTVASVPQGLTGYPDAYVRSWSQVN